MSSLNITPALAQYPGENSHELLRLAYDAMDVANDVTVYPDVKNDLRLTTLAISKIVKPFSSTFSPSSDVINFIPRTISVKVGKADLEVAPEDYRNTYLAHFMQKGVTRTPEDLPFEQFLWEDVMRQFGEELNSETAYFGVYNAAGTNAIAVADGYGTILAQLILGGEVIPNMIGAINSTDGVEQIKELYRRIPVKYRNAKTRLTAYMSHASYEAYEDSTEEKQYNSGTQDAMLKPKWARGADGILELKPVSWMGESERVIITPRANIVMAQDATTQDLAKMNVVQDVWTAKIGIAAALGFNFHYAPLIWCNEAL